MIPPRCDAGSLLAAGRPFILDGKMNLIVNGQNREVADGITLRSLVGQFNLVPEKVAIELNRRLVKSDKYDLPLKAGDEVEIVTFVGGG